MNIFFKKLLARYGVLFAAGFIGGFIFLSYMSSRFNLAVLPGDILIEGENYKVYIPLAGSTAIALAVVIGFEIYKGLKK